MDNTGALLRVEIRRRNSFGEIPGRVRSIFSVTPFFLTRWVIPAERKVTFMRVPSRMITGSRDISKSLRLPEKLSRLHKKTKDYPRTCVEFYEQV